MLPQSTANALESALHDLLENHEQEWHRRNQRQVWHDIIENTADEADVPDLIAAAKQETEIPSTPNAAGQATIIATVRQLVNHALTQAANQRWPTTPDPNRTTPDHAIWMPLTECRPAPGAPPPEAISIDEQVIPTVGKRGNTWYGLPIAIARWLIQQDLLTERHLPMTIIREAKPTISTTKRNMKAPHQITDGIYMETSAQNRVHVQRAIALLRRFQVDLIRCQIMAPPSIRDATIRPPDLLETGTTQRQPNRLA